MQSAMTNPPNSMKNRPKTLVVCATQSGSGKTSITLALIAAFRRRGLIVQPFKVGPDFLDPTYLAHAAGRPCYNLDGWMMGEGEVRASFARHSADADLCIVEGVMGLFDGAHAQGSAGSTAEIAALLGAPVLLVVDVRGMSRSAAALVKGFVEFDSAVKVEGVILNRVGSSSHGATIAEALHYSNLPPVLGTFTSGSLPALPSRHLGLVAADGAVLPGQTLDRFAETAASCCDLSAILDLEPNSLDTHPVNTTAVNPTSLTAKLLAKSSAKLSAKLSVRVGIARDPAFHFYYPDNLEALEERSAQLVNFSPLGDSDLPEIDLLYLGGGYPELFAAQLAANLSMRLAIKKYALAGRPLYAECGGLLYLSESIELRDGTCHPMVGVLPVRSVMRAKLAALRYVKVELLNSCLLGEPGICLRGHEFHYSETIATANSPCSNNPSPWKAAYCIYPRRSKFEESMTEGFACGDLLASYVHVHFASQPQVVDNLLARAMYHKQHPLPGRVNIERGS